MAMLSQVQDDIPARGTKNVRDKGRQTEAGAL